MVAKLRVVREVGEGGGGDPIGSRKRTGKGRTPGVVWEGENPRCGKGRTPGVRGGGGGTEEVRKFTDSA